MDRRTCRWPSLAAEQEIGQIGDAAAAIEAVVPLARIARQMLGADAVEGAVEPGLHVAEQDMDDGQHGIGVFAAVLDDRVVAEAVGEAIVALQTISDDACARLGCAADKAAQIRRGSGRQDGDAGAAGDKVALLMPWPRCGEAGTVSTAIAIRLLFGSVRPRPRLSGVPRPP